MSDVLDRYRSYTQAELEAVLGKPPVAVNGSAAGDSPTGRGLYDAELLVREEPMSGRPYWLMWRCAREGSGCWAIGDCAADTWRLVMLCPAHDRFYRYHDRRVTREMIAKRDEWIFDLRCELRILDGIELGTVEKIARYGPYRLDLQRADPEHREQMERVDTILHLLADESIAMFAGFSIANCPPQAAAIMLIADFLHGERVRLWPVGETEPLEVTIASERAGSNAFSRTITGETIVFSFEPVRRFDRIAAF